MKFRLSQDKSKLILVESSKGEYNQLKLYLTRKVHNYRFMKRFKLGVWDGSISYFNNDGSVPFGLWQEVYQCCKQYGYKFVIENLNDFPRDNNVTIDQVQDFVADFFKDHKTPDGKVFMPYEHQINSIFQILKHKYGLVEIATAGGKSLVFGTLLFYYLKNVNPDAKFLLIVPNISLVTQFYNDLNDYNYGFNSENKTPLDIRIDEVMSDKPRKYRDDEKKPNIFIGTYQSLEKWQDEWFRQFDVVFTDECLHPDTMITTIDGKKKISEMKEGDLVYTLNEKNGDIEIKEVEFVYKNLNKGQQMFEIEMENGDIINVTGNHEVILTNKKRKRVDQLNEKDEIFDFRL